jgi:hypothetical protein
VKDLQKIARLAGSKTVQSEHIAEAIRYRSLVHESWFLTGEPPKGVIFILSLPELVISLTLPSCPEKVEGVQ